MSDLITFEGETFSELEDAFKEAVDDYLEICAEIGKDPEKAYRGQFNVRINPSLHKGIALKAIKNDRPLNQEVAMAISEYLKPKSYERMFIESLNSLIENGKPTNSWKRQDMPTNAINFKSKHKSNYQKESYDEDTREIK